MQKMIVSRAVICYHKKYAGRPIASNAINLNMFHNQADMVGLVLGCEKIPWHLLPSCPLLEKFLIQRMHFRGGIPTTLAITSLINERFHMGTTLESEVFPLNLCLKSASPYFQTNVRFWTCFPFYLGTTD